MGMLGEAISHQQMVVDLQEAFGFFHNIGDGGITAEEIATMIRTLNQDRTAADDFRAMVSQLEANGNGAVEIQELLSVLTRKMKEADTEEELREAFKVFDKDQNGFISPCELRHVMINLGEKLTDEELEQMMKEADLDGDGLVNYDEFVKMMTAPPV